MKSERAGVLLAGAAVAIGVVAIPHISLWWIAIGEIATLGTTIYAWRTMNDKQKKAVGMSISGGADVQIVRGSYRGPDAGIDVSEQAKVSAVDVHAEATGRPAIGRNDPCYCGSGKKFKKCHGHQQGNT